MHLAISAMLNGIRKEFLGTRRHPARFLGTRKESLAPNCILTNLRARSTSTDRRIPHQMAGFLRILRHPIARTRRSPAGFFGTRKESLAPDSILANLRAQSTSTDRRIPHQTAGFLRITRHPTALDRILRPPAKFSSRETLGGDLKFMQNSFLPHRFPVARNYRRRSQIQAEFIFASPVSRRPKLSAAAFVTGGYLGRHIGTRALFRSLMPIWAV